MSIHCSTGFIDKLNGIRTNLVANGDFTSSASASWNINASSATLTNATAGQAGVCLTIANAGAAVGSIYQDITTVVGRMYRLSLYFKKDTGVSGGFAVGTTAAPTGIYNSGALTDATFTQYTIAFIATATTTRITLRNDSTTIALNSLFDTIVLDEVFDGIVDIFKNCKCNIYYGAQAADANTGAGTNLIATITINSTGTGLVFTTSGSVTALSLTKPATDIWSGLIVSTGTQSASWFRFYEAGDDPTTTNTTSARFDGTIATASADMLVGNVACANGLMFTVNNFTFTSPAN